MIKINKLRLRNLDNWFNYTVIVVVIAYADIKGAKARSRNSDAYQEEMKSWRDNFHRNNYTENITSTMTNLNRATESNTWKLTTVCLPYVKGRAEQIQKILRRIFTNSAIFRKYLFRPIIVFIPSHTIVVKYTKTKHAAH